MKQIAKALVPPSMQPSVRRLWRRLGRDDDGRFAAGPAREGKDPSVLACRIAYNKHGGYCIPLAAAHRPAAQAVLAGTVWEPETIAFLAALPENGDLVHAGTFFGDFLPALARSRKSGATVWGFEPNDENFRSASITVTLNGLDNVTLTHAALGERQDVAMLRTASVDGRALGGGSHIIIDDHAGPMAEHDQRTSIVALDAMIPDDRNVVAIHLDVEGFETPALCGARRIIRRNLPAIVVETRPGERWLAEHLWPLGYRFGPELHGNTVLLPRG